MREEVIGNVQRNSIGEGQEGFAKGNGLPLSVSPGDTLFVQVKLPQDRLGIGYLIDEGAKGLTRAFAFVAGMDAATGGV
jgi:hypothetical protein